MKYLDGLRIEQAYFQGPDLVIELDLGAKLILSPRITATKQPFIASQFQPSTICEQGGVRL